MKTFALCITWLKELKDIYYELWEIFEITYVMKDLYPVYINTHYSNYKCRALVYLVIILLDTVNQVKKEQRLDSSGSLMMW